MVKDEFIEFTPRKQKTALILAMIFILFDFGLNIYYILVNGFDYHMITSMLPCVMMGIYAVKGYLKPHGSNVKIMFLIKAVFIGLNVCSSTYVYSVTTVFLNCVVAATAYMAGRLNKIRTNIRIMFVITIVFLAIMISHAFVFRDMHMMGDAFNNFIQWIALAFIYYGRYEEHRAAGLEYDIRNFGPELQGVIKDLWRMLIEVKKGDDHEKNQNSQRDFAEDKSR